MKRLLLALMLSACGGEETPTGTFAEVQSKVFTPSCSSSSCHGAQGKRGNLVLEAGMAYANLVGVDAAHTGASGKKRVVAGDVANSFLVAKLKAPLDAALGEVMPVGTGGLEEDRRRIVEAWIAAGAKND